MLLPTGPVTAHGVATFAETDRPNLAASPGLGDILAQLDGLIGAYKIAELSGAAGSYDFLNIPATFRHLLLVCQLRCDSAATALGCNARFNNDASAVYDSQYIQAQAAAVVAAELFSAAAAYLGDVPGSTAGGNMFATLKLWIPNYTQTVNHHEWQSENFTHSLASTGGLRLKLHGGVHRALGAIGRLTLLPVTGNWIAGSLASLYGLP